VATKPKPKVYKTSDIPSALGNFWVRMCIAFGLQFFSALQFAEPKVREVAEPICREVYDDILVIYPQFKEDK